MKDNGFSANISVGAGGRGRALESRGDLENRLGKLEAISRHTGEVFRAHLHC